MGSRGGKKIDPNQGPTFYKIASLLPFPQAHSPTTLLSIPACHIASSDKGCDWHQLDDIQVTHAPIIRLSPNCIQRYDSYSCILMTRIFIKRRFRSAEAANEAVSSLSTPIIFLLRPASCLELCMPVFTLQEASMSAHYCRTYLMSKNKQGPHRYFLVACLNNPITI